MNHTAKSHQGDHRIHDHKHRFEHWYRDNQVYFITARCHTQFPAFASDHAKRIFWDRFDHYTAKCHFTPWITSLLDNHYHTLGYLKYGRDLAPMMKSIHGSTAKLVNDHLQAVGIHSYCSADSPLVNGRLVPFWGDGRNTYFDGCIRDERQAAHAYRYVLQQSVRHGLCRNWHDYPHTHLNIEMERAITRATELRAFLYGVPYKRYLR
ncbi:MAG: hypothetical protein D8M59_15560 [Planctomycetes bacterium]|nr:hypothetical protein [Planctomycetota bacterium]NOG55552.1 hypothetical protein [Planctomycetota bacterium]